MIGNGSPAYLMQCYARHLLANKPVDEIKLMIASMITASKDVEERLVRAKLRIPSARANAMARAAVDYVVVNNVKTRVHPMSFIDELKKNLNEQKALLGASRKEAKREIDTALA